MKTIEQIRSSKPNGFLYHYTSIDAFYNIVMSKSLLASQIQYLNDSKEFFEAFDIINDIIKNYNMNPSLAAKKMLVEKIPDSLRGMEDAAIFVFSLSEEPDLLSQWRAYCPNGGVSIGFNPIALKQWAMYQGFHLLPCIYDWNEQVSLLEELITEVITPLEYRPEGRRQELISAEIRKAIFGKFMYIAPFLKNSSFYEEREWRLMTGPIASYTNSGWRPKGGMLIPYQKLTLDIEGLKAKLTVKADVESPLRHVYIGPSSQQELLAASMKSFLRANNINLGVSLSKIPYRPI